MRRSHGVEEVPHVSGLHVGPHLQAGLQGGEGVVAGGANVLDGGENSRPCSSVTSRLVEIYGRAYWKGRLRDERIPPMIERAWRALRTKVWEYRGIGNCVGTSHGLERQTYLARPGDYSRVSRSSFLLSWMAVQKVRSC